MNPNAVLGCNRDRHRGGKHQYQNPRGIGTALSFDARPIDQSDDNIDSQEENAGAESLKNVARPQIPGNVWAAMAKPFQISDNLPARDAITTPRSKSTSASGQTQPPARGS